ncbi:hypothetical protein [Heyndrickxia acidicola]|uniref:Uncharacterized protein n=1 Tax=Heyndrickxia acidicola TaxID=209389 RepID=A0ABU6MJ18_9BACI|nr:hypothetical protein [Heyndrickxia acidicola]MED1204655.1 hypothetical protein [Heyndrickxia acidicola]
MLVIIWEKVTFFNINGHFFVNPWQLVSMDALYEIWENEEWKPTGV